jgi:hypothetical protein
MTEFTYTSLVGYREHILSGKATSQRNRILACLFESAVPLCRRQIAKLTNIEINAVCGRVNTLIKSELVRVVYEAVDPATNRLAEFIEPTWPQPIQREFHWEETNAL